MKKTKVTYYGQENLEPVISEHFLALIDSESRKLFT